MIKANKMKVKANECSRSTREVYKRDAERKKGTANLKSNSTRFAAIVRY